MNYIDFLNDYNELLFKNKIEEFAFKLKSYIKSSKLVKIDENLMNLIIILYIFERKFNKAAEAYDFLFKKTEKTNYCSEYIDCLLMELNKNLLPPYNKNVYISQEKIEKLTPIFGDYLIYIYPYMFNSRKCMKCKNYIKFLKDKIIFWCKDCKEDKNYYNTE